MALPPDDIQHDKSATGLNDSACPRCRGRGHVYPGLGFVIFCAICLGLLSFITWRAVTIIQSGKWPSTRHIGAFFMMLIVNVAFLQSFRAPCRRCRGWGSLSDSNSADYRVPADLFGSTIESHVLCDVCGYDLFQLARGGRCPECGTVILAINPKEQ